MVEDYYTEHPEEAEEIGLKIYRNDGVIEEMTELKAHKIAQKRMQGSSDGEKTTIGKQKKKRRVSLLFPHKFGSCRRSFSAL